MKLTHTFTNENLDANRIAKIFETQPQKGFEALHRPSWEVSTSVAGVGMDWKFESFALLEDAQQYAIQFIMPKGFLCKIVG